MGLPKIRVVFGEDKDNEKDIEHKNNSKRPLGIKLILAYVIFLQILAFVSNPGIAGLIAILIYSYTLYSGLWKMKKDWMTLFAAGLIILSIIYIYYWFVSPISVFYPIFVTLNILSLKWLYSHRKLFIEPEKGKSALGTKKEWIILGIVVILIIIMFLAFIYFT